MMRIPSSLRSAQWLAIALTASVLSTSVSFAGEFTVENYSNQNVRIAFAYERGPTVSYGWYLLQPTGSKTTSIPAQTRMFFRIEQEQPLGPPLELTFNVPTERYPATPDRFTVQNAPDDPSVRLLSWGPNLENRMNVRTNGPLPGGWDYVRFHQVAPGNTRLEIKP